MTSLRVPLESDCLGVSISERGYPPRLRGISAPPERLFLRGRLELLAMHRLVAVVGSRHATAAALAATRDLCTQIAAADAGVVSGLAAGIDAAAHEAALAAGAPAIAVLGGGPDRISPKQNRPLAARILASGGALATEQPPGTPSLPAYLVARNRLISGIAAAVIVVECEPGGGTMHTARFAAEQGRPILVPPPRGDVETEGGLQLLRERYGARSFSSELLSEALATPVPAVPEGDQMRLRAEGETLGRDQPSQGSV